MKQQFSHAQKKPPWKSRNLNGINFTVYLIRKKILKSLFVYGCRQNIERSGTKMPPKGHLYMRMT